jgi:hypothetical protein
MSRERKELQKHCLDNPISSKQAMLTPRLSGTYLEKYVGWMVTFTLPLAIYLPLPLVLWWLHKRLVVSSFQIVFTNIQY